MNNQNDIPHFEKVECKSVSKFETVTSSVFTKTNDGFPHKKVEVQKDDEKIIASKKELFEFEKNISNKYDSFETGTNIILCKEEIEENCINYYDAKVKLEKDESNHLQYREYNESPILVNQDVDSDLICSAIIVAESTNIANDMKKEHINTFIQNEHRTANSKRYICPECKYQTNILSAMKRHLATHNDLKPYQCTICKKHYKRRDKLERHSLTHLDEKKFHCGHCDYKTSDQSYLIRHLKSNHLVEKLHKCSKCPYETNNSYCLKTHLLKHLVSSEKKFRCSYCSYQTNYKGTLKRHVEVKHIDKERSEDNPLILENEPNMNGKEVMDCNEIYSCLKCTYKTNLKNNYTRHLNRHGVDKLYKCTICNKELCSKQRLDQHNLIHTGELLFKCNLCDYGARQKTSLKRHIQNKHQITDDRIKCPECEYRTSNKTDMKQHFVVHNDIKPFQCQMCDRAFKRSGDLKSHVLTHSGQKKFHCAHCDYKGNRKKNFVLHLNTKHLYTS